MEGETAFADREAMHAAILAMGFRPTVRILKVRRAAVANDLMLCLDEVDGWIPSSKLERMVPVQSSGEAVQAELVAFVEELGIKVERTEET